MAEILSGKEVSLALAERLKVKLEYLKVVPKLATVRVGENGADVAYEKSASKKLRDLGLEVENVVLQGDCEEQAMLDTVEWLGSRADVHGILVFQPLPKTWDVANLRRILHPKKDIDCSTFENMGKLMTGTVEFVPGAPGAVMELLKHFQIEVKGKSVCVIGRSTVVGRPLAELLMSAGATVTVCHSQTADLATVARSSDILMTSAGRAGLVTKDFVKEGQIVIDLSTNVVDGKLCGDICLDEIESIVKAYTPTPGGIGAITTTLLGLQVARACENL